MEIIGHRYINTRLTGILDTLGGKPRFDPKLLMVNHARMLATKVETSYGW